MTCSPSLPVAAVREELCILSLSLGPIATYLAKTRSTVKIISTSSDRERCVAGSMDATTATSKWVVYSVRTEGLVARGQQLREMKKTPVQQHEKKS